MRSESSFEMTSAATFFPKKFAAPASIDLNVEVNLIAAGSDRGEGHDKCGGHQRGAQTSVHVSPVLFHQAAADGTATLLVNAL